MAIVAAEKRAAVRKRVRLEEGGLEAAWAG
jgi:hypothetical protein